MHPVDLANRLVRQADLLVADSPGGPEIPNRFDVRINETDMDASINMDELTAELNRTLHATATDRGWRIGGPIEVRLGVDRTVGKGSIKCTASSAPAPLPAWGELAEHRGDRIVPLADNRTIVGRSEGADVKLDEAEISRQHAVIFREAGRLWINDLGSANGTTVNGQAIGTEPTEIGAGDMLSFGPVTFAVRIL